MFEGVDELAQATVTRLSVPVLDADCASEFAAKAESLPSSLPLILDLSRLEFTDSSGIGCLLSLQRTLVEEGSHLSIAGLQPRVRALFELVQLHRVIDVFNDVDEALRTIRSATSPSSPVEV